MGEPKWLNAEEMRAWQALLSGWALLDRQIEQHLKEDAGLSHAQYEILVRLAAAPHGKIRMTELADSLVNSKSGLTYQVDRLEKAGLVRRESCDTDVRGITATLTKAGRHKLDDAAPAHVTLVRELLIDVLTPTQLSALADGLSAVAHRIQTTDPRQRRR
ncbi:MarR family winged helix-turn-helix transcriptional regulator [Nocardia australiensis]|uniref:MarR family winged helix-turn-helix transcriptional regulator n=1 Tax=Nocardia australiensis TaxID=2887191 RepID=UPI001D15A729|nr:MarR family transcriptional regulator [Nocardia australiensis]